MRRGIWRFTCWPSRRWTRILRRTQLLLMLRNDYQHPNGQIPAYEWNFGDTNPPVHAYATMQIYLSDKERNNGKGDLEFLDLCVFEAAGELYLVAEPKGPRREQPV